jgi:CBS-domain-containing membrane protein
MTQTEVITIEIESPKIEVEVSTSSTETDNSSSKTDDTLKPRDLFYIIMTAIGCYFRDYFRKFIGVKGAKNMYQRPRWAQLILTFVGVFIGIGSTAVGHYYILQTTGTQEVSLLLAALGASAVLLYSEFKAPLSQPRHVFGGYLICGIVGTVCRIILTYIEVPNSEWVHPWMLTLSLTLSILLMQLTRTTHPPGGAVTVLIMLNPLVSYDILSI